MQGAHGGGTGRAGDGPLIFLAAEHCTPQRHAAPARDWCCRSAVLMPLSDVGVERADLATAPNIDASDTFFALLEVYWLQNVSHTDIHLVPAAFLPFRKKINSTCLHRDFRFDTKISRQYLSGSIFYLCAVKLLLYYTWSLNLRALK